METSQSVILRVFAVLDGRPGHEKQTMGIIEELGRYVNVEVTKISVTRSSVLEDIFNTLRLLLPGRGWSHPDLHNADLLIGTGSKTHLPLLLTQKGTEIPVVTCMSPAFYLRRFFDLCFVPVHDKIKAGNRIFHTLGAPNSSKNIGQHKKECGLILLGGIDLKSHKWESDEIVRKVKIITEKEPQRLWTISSSPRTPEETVSKIKELSDQFDNITFFDYRDTGSGWVEEQYNKNFVVWVTSDSISMVYEALTAGCKVGIIPMRWLRKDSKFKKNEDILLEKKLVITFSSWEQGNFTWGKSAELNEAQRCAEHIILRWWPKNLQ